MESKDADKEQPQNAAPSEPPKPESTENSGSVIEESESLDADIVDATDGKMDIPGEEEAPGVKKKKSFSPAKLKSNIYVIFFGLILLIGGGVTGFSMMKSSKKPPVATIGNQALSPSDLAEIANADANIGSSAQTLTVQSSTIFGGPVLVRGTLTTAGNLQSGGTIQAPNLVISGSSNLGTAQINTLQVASNTVVQGTTSLKDLNVSSAADFSGPITASQITVTKLIISGNGVLQIPNHISFTGATPGRTILGGGAAFGAGGSANIGGSDTSGTININTGANPAAGCFVQVTFNQPFPGTPRILISPYGAAAGNLNYYVTKSNTGFTLCTNNAAASNAVFGFDYFVAY